MRKKNNIPEISAEVLLNYLYPEMGNKWIVQNVPSTETIIAMYLL